MGGDTYRTTVEITPAIYDGSLHDAVPEAMYWRLVDGDDALQEFLGIDDPNRYIGEGEDTEHWQETEDFVITTAADGGSYILGQSVSCPEKQTDLYRKELLQLKYFQRVTEQPVNGQSLDARLLGCYIAAVDLPGVDLDVHGTEEISQAVQGLEESTAAALENGERYEVPVILRKVPEMDLSAVDEQVWEFVDRFLHPDDVKFRPVPAWNQES